MSERKGREVSYKFQVVNVKLMSAERSGDAAYTDIMHMIARNKVAASVSGQKCEC